MSKLADYKLETIIKVDSKTTLWRGYSGDSPVLVKLSQANYTSPAEISKLQHEFNILKLLSTVEGVTQAIAFEQNNGQSALIMTDKGSVPLSVYLQEQAINLADALTIAIEI